MTWTEWHTRSEVLASEAAAALRTQDASSASRLYAEAAKAEQEALDALDPTKHRTRGITAVSAVSLWFKAGEFKKAETLAYACLGASPLPAFAFAELRTLVQAIWTEAAKESAGTRFLPGQVNVSVKGGEIVTGGAPLDLVVEKVQTIQSMFYRTLEQVQAMPLRQRGSPPRQIQEACRPWLFQAPPGSYQFTVVIQKPVQPDFFRQDVDPSMLTEHFLSILRATAANNINELERLVPDKGYQTAFVKLARNLAPSGGAYEQLEVRTAHTGPVAISKNTKQAMSAVLRRLVAEPPPAVDEVEVAIGGILRAVNLDKDWLDISQDGSHHHVIDLKDTHDDVIGPMVNRRVLVRAVRTADGRLLFRDIELDG